MCHPYCLISPAKVLLIGFYPIQFYRIHDKKGVQNNPYVYILGEHMTELELAEYLTTLLGFTEEGGSSEQQEFDTENAATIVDEQLAPEITHDLFANKLLGLGMYGSSRHSLLAVDQASDGAKKPAVANA